MEDGPTTEGIPAAVAEDSPETVVEGSSETVAEPKAPRVTTPARQKDPKKVAAGLAGAASRKAKQAHLLEELRKAKDSQRNTSGAPPSEDSASPPTRARGTPPPAPRADGSITPWVIGVAACLGLAYWAASRRAPVNPPAPPQKQATPPPAQQLKVAHNPFYME